MKKRLLYLVQVFLFVALPSFAFSQTMIEWSQDQERDSRGSRGGLQFREEIPGEAAGFSSGRILRMMSFLQGAGMMSEKLSPPGMHGRERPVLNLPGTASIRAAVHRPSGTCLNRMTRSTSASTLNFLKDGAGPAGTTIRTLPIL